MTRLIPPLLTAAAIWALCLAESHAQNRAPLDRDDPVCRIAEAGSSLDGAGPAPGCPEPNAAARP